VEVAGVTTELREAMASQQAAWMGVVTSNASKGQNPAATLVASSAAYVEAADRMDRLVDPSSRAAHRWSDLVADPVNAVLQRIYMDQVAQVLELGFSGQFDVGNVLFELNHYMTVSETAPVVAENHIMVVDAALADMGDLAELARLNAIGERHHAILIAAAVSTLVVLSATLVLRSVLWPLRRLGTVAEALRRGSLDEHIVEHGLRETRSVAEAMNEAVDHLKLAERQALALADERLDDPVLEESVPGLLGSSLQGAVSRLTSSLNEREEFARKLAYEATHDGLTQLANRRATLDHLERALARVRRGDGYVGVLFIDIDGFKTVNDMFGHAAGDLVLVTMADRLKASLRQGDLAGRLGGDEFWWFSNHWLRLKMPHSWPNACFPHSGSLCTMTRPQLFLLRASALRRRMGAGSMPQNWFTTLTLRSIEPRKVVVVGSKCAMRISGPRSPTGVNSKGLWQRPSQMGN